MKGRLLNMQFVITDVLTERSAVIFRIKQKKKSQPTLHNIPKDLHLLQHHWEGHIYHIIVLFDFLVSYYLNELNVHLFYVPSNLITEIHGVNLLTIIIHTYIRTYIQKC